MSRTVLVQSALIAAIQGRRVIKFNDEGGYQRTGEPHLLGVCAETGRRQLEIFQTAGATAGSRGHLPQWRRFDVDVLWNLRITAVEFVARDDFNAQSPRWSDVIVSVSVS
jgi:hypothetical protein